HRGPGRLAGKGPARNEEGMKIQQEKTETTEMKSSEPPLPLLSPVQKAMHPLYGKASGSFPVRTDETRNSPGADREPEKQISVSSCSALRRYALEATDPDDMQRTDHDRVFVVRQRADDL